MITITDIIIIICCVFLLWRGANRGFIGSLLGPIALILATIVSLVYFLWTKDIVTSLCIGLFGPFILAWIFRFFLRSWTKMSNPQGVISPASRVGGALITFGWGMVMLVITLLLLAMVPPINPPLQMMYKDVHLSKFYHLIKPLDSSAIDKPSPEETMESLSKDKRIQDIVNDPQITEAINRKDYAALMSNPKIMGLVQDPQMVKKMMSVYRQVLQQQAGSQ